MEEVESQWGLGTRVSSNLRDYVEGGEEARAFLRKLSSLNCLGFLYLLKKNTTCFRITTNSILEKEMATHSSILAWKIPWTEQPGGLSSMGLRRVGHN